MSQQAESLSEAAYEILRAAVNLARFGQYRRPAALLNELRRRFPGQEADIAAAIAYWMERAPSREE
ncbi:hypothetical protein AB4Y45_35320 [Paraburkholderia sp. EG287A]|uniref:hypothetical protein n=1 Tax=Paraburkholderia sp. EG287A TaxID=3237012 RepID=UPI0034D1C7DC